MALYYCYPREHGAFVDRLWIEADTDAVAHAQGIVDQEKHEGAEIWHLCHFVGAVKRSQSPGNKEREHGAGARSDATKIG